MTRTPESRLLDSVQLVVVHHHFRPGGVRRVIELALSAVVGRGGRVREVVLAGGEAPEPVWLEALRSRLAPVPVRWDADPALGYRAEARMETRTLRRRVRAWVRRVAGPVRAAGAGAGEVLLWVHNPGLGRNLVMIEELGRALEAGRFRCVWHHHDWWFDNRWQHWPALRRDGRSLDAVARALLCPHRHGIQVAINRADQAGLQRGWGRAPRWWPNPVAGEAAPSRAAIRAARDWVARQAGTAAARRYWLLPSRFLRRKNVPEAILVTRWLRPEAWLVTTGGPSSPDEQPAFEELRVAIARNGWRVALGVLAGAGAEAPSVSELLGGCEAVVFTSMLEGFGLPYLEAATAGRPLVGRSLSRVLPDLGRFGFRFPTVYPELWVAPDLFDWDAEVRRQTMRFAGWRAGLPRRFRAWAGRPPILADGPPRPMSFARLTRVAQLEVLEQPADFSWRRCGPLNPGLASWRDLAADGALPAVAFSEWGRRRLGPRAYARRFWEAVDDPDSAAAAGDDGAPLRVQEALVRERLSADQSFPALWAPEA